MSSDPIDELMASLQRLGRLFASRNVASRFTTAAGVEVSQQGAALLRVLLRDGQMAIAALVAATPMEIAAVSRQVRVIEQAGAIRRTRSPDGCSAGSSTTSAPPRSPPVGDN